MSGLSGRRVVRRDELVEFEQHSFQGEDAFRDVENFGPLLVGALNVVVGQGIGDDE